MKKQLVVASLVMLGIFTISCGGKNGETKSEVKTEEVADCPCNTLIDTTGYLKDKNYTGTCADKDQNDTIILKKEYKNGYLISEMTKEKIKGKYYITTEMTYDNEEFSNGYVISPSEIYNRDGQKYSGYYKSYKDGRVVNQYRINIDFYPEDGYRIGFTWDIKNGKEIGKATPGTEIDNVSEESRPKCMPDSEINQNLLSDNWQITWNLANLDKATFDKVINGLRKELPKFFYVE